MNLDDVARQVETWFADLAGSGPDLRVTAHNKSVHEVKEFEETPIPSEAADVLMCLIGSLNHHGFTVDDLTESLQEILDKNRSSGWNLLDDGTYRRVR
jgi:hypothetical protein